MKEILHATVASHRITTDIYWNTPCTFLPLDDLLQFNETVRRTREDSGLSDTIKKKTYILFS